MSMPARSPARIRGASSGTEDEQVIAIRRRADLHLVESRQHAQFVAQRAQVFDPRLELADRRPIMWPSPRPIDWK